MLTLGCGGGVSVPLPLPPHTVTKSADGSVKPQYIDLQLEHSKTTYKLEGKPIVDGLVKNEITQPDGKIIKFEEITDITGSVESTLPPTPNILTIAHTKEGQPQKPYTRTVDPIKRPDGPQQPTPIEVDDKPKNIVGGVHGSGTVYLVDISGSMGSGTRMQQLQSGLLQTLEDHKRQGTRFAMGAWNSNTNFPGGALQWLNGEADYAIVKQWIGGLRPGGGNDMHQAFELVLRRSHVIGYIEDAQHVYCACDGDITPFSVESWTTYRAEFPDVRFEFGLFGDEASDDLQRMGMIGGGGFRVLGDTA